MRLGHKPLAILLVGLLLSSCARDADRDRSAAPANSPSNTIGVSLLTLQNPFFKVIGDSIRTEAVRHGYEVIVLDADRDVVRQGNHVKDFIVKGVSAIVLSPCEADSIGPIIREANAAGIPVFTVDIPCRLPDVEIVSQVATDNYGGGRKAGEAMIEALGGAGGKIAILDFKLAESCRLRVQGFKEVIEAHNRTAAAPIVIAAELDGGGLKDPGYKAAEDLTQSHSDLVGIFAINDPSALGARAALENAGKENQVTIIGFDGQPEGKQAIKDGKIYADPIQFPDQMGIQVVQAIVKHSKGEVVEGEILIATRLYRKEDAMIDPDLDSSSVGGNR
jgi:ribose transport system substrate-binding protein